MGRFFKSALQITKELKEPLEEYLEAKKRHSLEKSYDARLRNKLQGRTDDAALAMLFRQSKEFKLQSKAMWQATQKWLAAQARARLAGKAFASQKELLAALIGAPAETRMEQLSYALDEQKLEEVRKAQVDAIMNDPANVEAIQAAKARMSSKQSLLTESPESPESSIGSLDDILNENMDEIMGGKETVCIKEGSGIIKNKFLVKTEKDFTLDMSDDL